MTAFKQSHNRRWYDDYENLYAMTTLGQSLPENQQTDIAEDFYTLIKPYKAFLKEGKSLGVEIILRLNRSMTKNRWYDSIAAFNKAFHILTILPEALLSHLDANCYPFTEVIIDSVSKKHTVEQSRLQKLAQGNTQVVFRVDSQRQDTIMGFVHTKSS